MPTSLQPVHQALTQLGAVSSVSEKVDLLTKYGRQIPEFKDILVYALDPYRKYGIKTLPAPQAYEGRQTLVADPGAWSYLRGQLDALSTRAMTGGQAKTALAHLLSRLDSPTRQVLQKVLLKDLRCGVGATLVNRVFPGLVPEFGIMLATPLEQKHLKKLQAQRWVYFQAKKNGDRSAHIIDPDTPAAYSRKGHPQMNYGHITDALTELCRSRGIDMVFDGEVINTDFWGTRKVKKLAGHQASSAVLHVFDVVELSQWMCQHTAPYGERRRTLKRLFHEVTEGMPIVRVPSFKVAGSDVTWELLEAYRNKFMEMGEEGLMIRLDEPYNFKTRSSLFKFKDMKEEDFMIMEVRQGEEGKKYEHVAAKILVDLGNGDSCEVGLKGDMAFRKWLWENRNQVSGSMCEVHFQDWTENEKGEPALQFGVMHKLRFDKS